MTGFLKAWTMSVAGIIVFGSICEMILPNSSYKKYVHLAIGLMLILSLLSPFVKNKFDIDAELPQDKAYTQYDNMEDRQKSEVLSLYKRKLCEKIKGEIEKSSGIEVEIRCEVSEAEETFGNIERVYIIADSNGGKRLNQGAVDILKKDYGLSDEKIDIKYLRQGG